MDQNVPAFALRKNGKTLDYRLGRNLDTEDVASFFESKGYSVGNLYFAGRHVVGKMSKEKNEYFLKLATTEGMSVMTENEHEWDKQFNLLVPRATARVWVPLPFESGYFQDRLFYHITDVFAGTELATSRTEFSASPELRNKLEMIIDVSELIQNLQFKPFRQSGEVDEMDHRSWFVKKTKLWLESTPVFVSDNYQLTHLLKQIEEGSFDLRGRPRHGDFTPWHMMLLSNGKLGLLDGEHALVNGVENYDIAYFIQRVFSVLKRADLAEIIIEKLKERTYDMKKLQTVLLARAIGGFLDESLAQKPDYETAQSFAEWCKGLYRD